MKISRKELRSLINESVFDSIKSFFGKGDDENKERDKRREFLEKERYRTSDDIYEKRIDDIMRKLRESVQKANIAAKKQGARGIEDYLIHAGVDTSKDFSLDKYDIFPRIRKDIERLAFSIDADMASGSLRFDKKSGETKLPGPLQDEKYIIADIGDPYKAWKSISRYLYQGRETDLHYRGARNNLVGLFLTYTAAYTMRSTLQQMSDYVFGRGQTYSDRRKEKKQF